MSPLRIDQAKGAVDQTQVRAPANQLELSLELRRFPNVVGVEEGEQVSAGELRAGVPSGRMAVMRLTQQSDLGPEPSHDLGVPSVEPSSTTMHSTAPQDCSSTLAIASWTNACRCRRG